MKNVFRVIIFYYILKEINYIIKYIFMYYCFSIEYEVLCSLKGILC